MIQMLDEKLWNSTFVRVGNEQTVPNTSQKIGVSEYLWLPFLKYFLSTPICAPS